MGKDMHLVNIYLKIHNKRALTMDDLQYLAKYSPECFEKTCKNVVYNFPEAKPIMEPEEAGLPPINDEPNEELQERQKIENILDNLKLLETNDFPVPDVDADEVKSLLGDLYMELLFPHNDKNLSMNLVNDEDSSLFDKKI